MARTGPTARTARTALTARTIRTARTARIPQLCNGWCGLENVAPAPNGGVYTHEFRISSEAFSWISIKKAAYRFSGRCSFDFQSNGKDIVCKLLFAKPERNEVVTSIELAFRNELLDQDLRSQIAEETTPVRNAVLAFAFSKSGIQGPDEI